MTIINPSQLIATISVHDGSHDVGLSGCHDVEHDGDPCGDYDGGHNSNQ